MVLRAPLLLLLPALLACSGRPGDPSALAGLPTQPRVAAEPAPVALTYLGIPEFEARPGPKLNFEVRVGLLIGPDPAVQAWSIGQDSPYPIVQAETSTGWASLDPQWCGAGQAMRTMEPNREHYRTVHASYPLARAAFHDADAPDQLALATGRLRVMLAYRMGPDAPTQWAATLPFPLPGPSEPLQ